jgi:phospholipid/cholesterol/gamma-HCH transport system ATP-binding protein
VDLKKSFGSKVVLDGISFSVAPGESLVIVGPSGTGKSVLLKHLIGLVRPDSGKVFVAGEDLWALSHVERTRVRKKFGMSFQEGAPSIRCPCSTTSHFRCGAPAGRRRKCGAA